ncbi:uncharacterized protein LOC108665168 [Hyalella azteca]|uniref:Uncharacterized protein LOC108665168 n=1 Tax=Hyalella azteca TaxID=294128 RepID=A0A8B7N1F7_HYAAZ|nr:uncharacterized protein LOC108665168 [Hyalella azteca]
MSVAKPNRQCNYSIASRCLSVRNRFTSSSIQNCVNDKRRLSDGLESAPVCSQALTGDSGELGRRTNSEPRLVCLFSKYPQSTNNRYTLKECLSDVSLAAKKKSGGALPVLQENFVSVDALVANSDNLLRPPLPLKQKSRNCSGRIAGSPLARPQQLNVKACYSPEIKLQELLELDPDTFIFGKTEHTAAMERNRLHLNPVVSSTLPFPINTCLTYPTSPGGNEETDTTTSAYRSGHIDNLRYAFAPFASYYTYGNNLETSSAKYHLKATSTPALTSTPQPHITSVAATASSSGNIASEFDTPNDSLQRIGE